MAKARKPSSPKPKLKPRLSPQLAAPRHAAPPAPPGTGRASLKTQILDDLLRRPEGASLADMALATGWKGASVRGVISGVFRKRLGRAVTTSLRDGIRIYRITP